MTTPPANVPPERRRADGDGGSSDDDRQPEHAGQTGTLGEHADDRPVPPKRPPAGDPPARKRPRHRSGGVQKSREATSDQRSR